MGTDTTTPIVYLNSVALRGLGKATVHCARKSDRGLLASDALRLGHLHAACGRLAKRFGPRLPSHSAYIQLLVRALLCHHCQLEVLEEIGLSTRYVTR